MENQNTPPSFYRGDYATLTKGNGNFHCLRTGLGTYHLLVFTGEIKMSAQNLNTGFQFVKGPKVKLKATVAHERHLAKLAEIDKELKELGAMLAELEELAAPSKKAE